MKMKAVRLLTRSGLGRADDSLRPGQGPVPVRAPLPCSGVPEPRICSCPRGGGGIHSFWLNAPFCWCLMKQPHKRDS